MSSIQIGVGVLDWLLPTVDIPSQSHTVYIAVTALVLNLVVAIAATAVFRVMRLPAGTDETQPVHYLGR